jgi:hypothetical protein
VKEAIINACNRHGQDGKGKGGLEGYLFRLARDEPKTMAMLLRAVLPTQITVERVEPAEPYTSFEELQQQLAQLGFALERAPLPHYKGGPEIVLDAPNDTQVHTNEMVSAGHHFTASMGDDRGTPTLDETRHKGQRSAP